MSSILEPLIDRLRNAGPHRWEQIAQLAGTAKTLPRKLVYGDRDNPTVLTIQPLVDFFAAIDRGERVLPEPDVRTGATPKVVATPSGAPVAQGRDHALSKYLGRCYDEKLTTDRRQQQMPIDHPDRRRGEKPGG